MEAGSDDSTTTHNTSGSGSDNTSSFTVSLSGINESKTSSYSLQESFAAYKKRRQVSGQVEAGFVLLLCSARYNACINLYESRQTGQ